jgi:hypothetical protein
MQSLKEALCRHDQPTNQPTNQPRTPGYTYSGTNWLNWRDWTLPVAAPPYDIDADPTTFSAEERRRIIATWRSVSEDFYMWVADG